MPPVQLTPCAATDHDVRSWIASEMPVVLIVDCYSDEGEMYADYLRSVGAHVDVDYVHTPEEALSRLASDPPAVIVTDMVFERSAYDGPSFMRTVRARPEGTRTRLIVLSGFTRTVDRERARAAGADLYLVKPCAPDELLRSIERAIGVEGRESRMEWNWPEEQPGPYREIGSKPSR